MNKNKDLLESFRDFLNSSYQNKKELISILSNILKAEPISISRRLNGNIQFTIREMGMICESLNISIDHLLTKEPDSILLSMNLLMPSSSGLLESLEKEIEESKKKLKKIENKPIHVGYVFDSIPIEFIAPYPNLCKFFYYRWAYYFSDEYIHRDYSNWSIPPSIKQNQEELIDFRNNFFESIFYIWDYPVISNIAREIAIFKQMGIISDEDALEIKQSLHSMLYDIESLIINEEAKNSVERSSFELYISNIKIGFTCIYYDCKEDSFIHYNLPFSQTTRIENNIDAFNKVYRWVNSIKKISTLISGSGAIYRRIFFEEQHKIIDSN